MHEAVLGSTTNYLKTRPRYGGTPSDLPVLRDRVGGMEARFRAARILAYQAVHLLDRGLPCDAELINSTYVNHRWATRTAQDAMELHGANALDSDYPIQHLWRDIKHTYPPAGTGEVQRIRLADAAIDETPQQWSYRFTAPSLNWALRSSYPLSPRARHPVNPGRARAVASLHDMSPPRGLATPRRLLLHSVA
ncbi:acyl-CoA dehydrogenase family protein [Streptomyces chartreusis]|uniref:acyl-CoA dehydrogenase family protein n=1 Tax=Streptomyces chartreusis TaxID=1969 RepID=UPI0036552EC2